MLIKITTIFYCLQHRIYRIKSVAFNSGNTNNEFQTIYRGIVPILNNSHLIIIKNLKIGVSQFSVLIRYGVLLVVLFRIERFPPASRKDMLVPLVPAA